MALRSLLLLLFLLAPSYLVSLNAIPMSRLNKLSTPAGGLLPFVSEAMKQSNEDSKKIEKGRRIEGRMEIEKNDYEPVQSNPVHTPTPPTS